MRSSVWVRVVVVVVLALGIGANTALFSLIDKVLLHPFPFRDLDRLVEIQGLTAGGKATGNAPIEMDFFATHVRAFEQTGMWKWQNLVVRGVDATDSVFALEVSQHVFEILGVAPALGRTFVPADFDSSAPPVVILADRLWRRQFRADTGIVGRQILLDGKGYTVVGVMGPEFVFTNPAHQVWVPSRPGLIAAEELKHYWSTIARLRPGVSVEQAQKEVDAITPGLTPNPQREAGWHARVRPFTAQSGGDLRRALPILWGAVGLVLLIACANAANLMLARASERGREFAIRAALGANRSHVMRQIFGETLKLGIAAGVLGIVLAYGLIHLPLPQLEQVSINPAALGATVALVLLTTILCAIPACIATWRADLLEGLNAASRTASASRGANRTRSAMVMIEVALSLVLLVGAGLMLRTLDRLLRVHLGFETQHVLTARVSVPPQLKKAEQAGHYTRVLGEVRALPGVRDASITTVLPFGNLVATVSLTVEGLPDAKWRSYPIYLREISPDYFSALGVHLLRGRDFNAGDAAGSPPVVIVNDEMARHYWPGQDPLGKRVSGSEHPQANEWATIVGVVESIKHRSLRIGADAELYRPYTQSLMGAKYTYLVLHAQGDPLSIASSLRQRMHELEPDQPVGDFKTMRMLVANSASTERFHAQLLEIFAGLALGLTVTGIFAVVSYSVSQRTREIGIRGALGATPRDVARFVLAMAMRPVVVGACLGIAGALAATRVLQSELFETPAADPIVLLAVCGLLLASAAAAAWLPAWRAQRIDPADVLRAE